MPTLIIGYDLNKEGPNYATDSKTLIARIKQLCPTYWHHLDSTWLVVTDIPAFDLATDLWGLMDANDELFVAPLVPGEGAWGGFSERARNWLERFA